MMYFFVRWAISTIALGSAVIIVKGLSVSGLYPLIVSSLVIGFLNAILRPIMLLLTLPLNILTMGTFTFIINAVIILMTSQIVRGFNVSGFWAAFTAALLMSLISFILTLFVHQKDQSDY